MRRRGVQRSEARGRGVGQWRHRFGKYADSPSTWKQEGCVFGFLHPETVFKKVRFQDPCGQSAKTMQNVCVFTKECFRVDGPLVHCSQSREDQLRRPAEKNNTTTTIQHNKTNKNNNHKSKQKLLIRSCCIWNVCKFCVDLITLMTER